MKLKYLRHPLRTFSTGSAIIRARMSMRSFAAYGRRRFKDDNRYDPQSVTSGFAARMEEPCDDSKLLDRICTAYIRAVEREQTAPEAYHATEWWEQVRKTSLAPVRQALLTRNTAALQAMYRNFYRDSCSAGLLGVPYGMTKAYLGGNMKNVHAEFYLSHVLCRIDYWMDQTENKFAIDDLNGPPVGNPFGIQLGKTLVRVGAEYAHYCSHRIGMLLEGSDTVVAEIGGGFGNMAYYLLRDHPSATYINLDVPESVALSSYYLMKALPHLDILLYGERELTNESLAGADVVLMPVFELDRLPAQSVDVVFSSHAMSDLSTNAMNVYLNNIVRVTHGSFLYVGNKRASNLISETIRHQHGGFALTNSRFSGWHSHKISGAGVGGAAGLTAAAMFEQRFTRTSVEQLASV